MLCLKHTDVRCVAARERATLAAKREAAANGASELSEFFYANAVMHLFRHVANIVEQHGRLVERHYGEGRIGKVVERVQVETDTQREIIIDRQCSQRGSLSVLRIGLGQTTNRSQSSPGENCAQG